MQLKEQSHSKSKKGGEITEREKQKRTNPGLTRNVGIFVELLGNWVGPSRQEKYKRKQISINSKNNTKEL